MINRESGSLEQNSHEERNLLETPDSATGKDFPGFSLPWCVCVFTVNSRTVCVFKSCSLFVGKYIYFFVFVVNIQYLLSINFQKWYGFNIDQLMYGYCSFKTCLCNAYLCLVHTIFVEHTFAPNSMQRLHIVSGHYQRILEPCSFVLIFRSRFVLIFRVVKTNIDHYQCKSVLDRFSFHCFLTLTI